MLDTYVLRHAWLNLSSEHITAGRINQVSVTKGYTKGRLRYSAGTLHRNAGDFCVLLFASAFPKERERLGLSPPANFRKHPFRIGTRAYEIIPALHRVEQSATAKATNRICRCDVQQ